MSLAGISSTSFSQPHISQAQASPARSYFRQRGSDLQQLGQSLLEGDLAGAQQAYNAITQLASSAPWQNGATTGPFKYAQRAQDFAAIGQALQSGDLQGAQKAFATLQQDLHPNLSRGSGSGGGSGQSNGNTIAEIIMAPVTIIQVLEMPSIAGTATDIGLEHNVSGLHEELHIHISRPVLAQIEFQRAQTRQIETAVRAARCLAHAVEVVGRREACAGRTCLGDR